MYLKLFYNFFLGITGFLMPSNARSANIFIAFIFIVALYDLYKNNQFRQVKHIFKLSNIAPKIRKNLYELFFLIVFSLFSSPNLTYSAVSFIVYFVMMSSFWAIYTLHPKIFINLQYFFISYAIGLGYLFFKTYYYRMEPSGKGLAIIVPIIFLYMKAYLNWTSKKKYLVLLLVLTILGLLNISFAHSATSKLMCIISPMVYMAFKFLPHKINIISLKTFIVIISIIFPAAIYFMPLEKVLSTHENLEPSFKHRLCILKYSMDKIIENPLSGNGFKASRFFNDESKTCFIIHSTEPLSKNNSGIPIAYNAALHPHNFIIQILFEMGIFGLLVFITITYRLIVLLDKNYEYIPNLELNMALLSCFFIIYIFSYSIWETWLLSSIFLLIMINKISKNRAQEIDYI